MKELWKMYHVFHKNIKILSYIKLLNCDDKCYGDTDDCINGVSALSSWELITA